MKVRGATSWFLFAVGLVICFFRINTHFRFCEAMLAKQKNSEIVDREIYDKISIEKPSENRIHHTVLSTNCSIDMMVLLVTQWYCCPSPGIP